jgi:hypothetical protein
LIVIQQNVIITIDNFIMIDVYSTENIWIVNKVNRELAMVCWDFDRMQGIFISEQGERTFSSPRETGNQWSIHLLGQTKCSLLSFFRTEGVRLPP